MNLLDTNLGVGYRLRYAYTVIRNTTTALGFLIGQAFKH